MGTPSALIEAGAAAPCFDVVQSCKEVFGHGRRALRRFLLPDRWRHLWRGAGTIVKVGIEARLASAIPELLVGAPRRPCGHPVLMQQGGRRRACRPRERSHGGAVPCIRILGIYVRQVVRGQLRPTPAPKAAKAASFPGVLRRFRPRPPVGRGTLDREAGRRALWPRFRRRPQPHAPAAWLPRATT